MTMEAIEAPDAMAAEMRAELEQGASPPGKQVTVRDLLSWFDYSRRGTQVVAQIGRRLAEIGLRSGLQTTPYSARFRSPIPGS